MEKIPKVLILIFSKALDDRFLSNFDSLDYPKDKIKIVISCYDNSIFLVLKKYFEGKQFDVELYEDIYKTKGGAQYINSLVEATKCLIKDKDFDFIITINDDVVNFSPNLIKELVKVNKHTDKDIVAPYIYKFGSETFFDIHCFRTLDGEQFPSGHPLNSPCIPPPNKNSKEPFEVNSVGCIVCSSKEVFLNSSFVDELDITECLTFCRSARRKGYRIFALPYLRAYHAYDRSKLWWEKHGDPSEFPSHRPRFPKVTKKDWKLLWSK